ncbi:MAG TPA: hypothetical protein DD738_11470 [Ruminiclostridium sp.]|nr:hypothetical protein [Ruminiclostridium sp.]
MVRKSTVPEHDEKRGKNMELSIGKNIQNKRRSMGMTQDQLATVLGVSIAAVSKWETGGTYPDITLLPPLARLLDSTVDDLLGFEAQLSDEQVKALCDRCAKQFETSSWESALDLCEKFVREYPNNLLLKLRIGSVLMMHTPCAGTEDAAAELIGRAADLIREATKSEDIQIRDAAWLSLSGLLIQQQQYEDALKALEEIHRSAADPEAMKVSVYYAMGNLEKSKQTAQYLLASHTSACDIALVTLSKIARKENNYPLALRMENLSLQLSQMFDRDKLYGQDLVHHLMIARYYTEQEKIREALDALHRFVKCAKMPNSPEAVKESPFFDRIEMNKTSISKDFLDRCAYQMVKEEQAFGPLKDHPEFINILKELEQ